MLFMLKDVMVVFVVSIALFLLCIVVVPGFKTGEPANRTSCLGNISQIGKALNLYNSSFGRWPEIDMKSSSFYKSYLEDTGLAANAAILKCPSSWRDEMRGGALSGDAASTSVISDYLSSPMGFKCLIPNVVVMGDCQKENDPSEGNHKHRYSSLLFKDGHAIGESIAPSDPNLKGIKGAYYAGDYMYSQGEPGLSQEFCTYLH